MVFFEKRITIRMRKQTWNLVKEAVAENEELYDNESHFVRVAVIRALNELKG